jgi:hypothetical protein
MKRAAMFPEELVEVTVVQRAHVVGYCGPHGIFYKGMSQHDGAARSVCLKFLKCALNVLFCGFRAEDFL